MNIVRFIIASAIIGNSLAGEDELRIPNLFLSRNLVSHIMDISERIILSLSSFTSTFPIDATQEQRVRSALLKQAWMLVWKRCSRAQNNGQI